VNKSGLIDAVSKTTSLAKRDAEDAVNAVFRIVSSEVRVGRRVVVTGFGSFTPTRRPAHMGRNPRTGAPVKVAASRGVRFAAGGALKDVLNGRAGASGGTVPRGDGAPTRIAATKAAPAAGRARRKVVGRAPARTAAARASTRTAARQSARKAAGRPPAKRASQRSAKKAVRRA